MLCGATRKGMGPSAVTWGASETAGAALRDIRVIEAVVMPKSLADFLRATHHLAAPFRLIPRYQQTCKTFLACGNPEQQ
jgi:hypothetical protein